MDNNEKKVTVKLTSKDNTSNITNPLTTNYSDNDKLSLMIVKILNEEFPMIKNNSLLYDLVLYSLEEKLKTVQKVENVLSYIKENHVKKVDDVSIKNGEIYIKCSVWKILN